MSPRALAPAILATAALVLTGCSDAHSPDRYVCVDRLTHTRVPDARCQITGPMFTWWLLRPGTAYPGMGGRVSAGASARPSVKPSPLPTKAGVVPRPKAEAKVSPRKRDTAGKPGTGSRARGSR